MNWLISLVRSGPESFAATPKSAQSSLLMRMARLGVFGELGTPGIVPAAYAGSVAAACAVSFALGLRCMCTKVHDERDAVHVHRVNRGGTPQ